MADPRDAFFDIDGIAKNLGQRTGRSAVTVVFYSIVKLVIALCVTAVLARLVPPAQQGLVAIAIPFVLIAVGLSEFGLAQTIVQMPRVTHRLATSLFWVNVGLGLLLTVTIVALAPVLASVLGQPASLTVFVALAPYVLISVLNTQYVALLRRKMLLRELERSILIATVSSSIIAVFIALSGYGVAAMISQLLVQQLLTLGLLVVTTRWMPSLPDLCALKEARKALAFGGFLASERILNDLGRAIQVAVMSKFFGEASTGLFYRTETFALMPQRRLVSPLSGAFIPALSRLQDDKDAFTSMLRHQVVKGNLVLVPVGAFFMTCPDVIVIALLGESWIDAVPMLQVLGIFALLSLTMSCFVWALVAVGEGRLLLYFRLASLTFVILGTIVAIPLGAIAIVQSYVLTSSVLSLPLLVFFVVRGSCVGARAAVGIISQTLGFAAITIGGSNLLRDLLSMSIWKEASFVAAFLSLSVAFYVVVYPNLLEDIQATMRRQ